MPNTVESQETQPANSTRGNVARRLENLLNKLKSQDGSEDSSEYYTIYDALITLQAAPHEPENHIRDLTKMVGEGETEGLEKELSRLSSLKAFDEYNEEIPCRKILEAARRYAKIQKEK